MQTPLLSLQNYWRSGNTSSSMYHCPYLNACHGDPDTPGYAAGDDACKTGYYGPVCQICVNGYYGYSQGCKCAAAPLYASIGSLLLRSHALAHSPWMPRRS
jgi:hypothetical protein